MNQNEIITAVVALMVCGLLAGATAIPLIAGISQETITEEYNDEANAGWLRMAYDNKPFDVEITADGDNISAGGQTGLNDDMILYADASACVMCVNGAFVIVNGYADTPEVINATSVAITNAGGSLTVEADGDTVITATSPAWAYYPNATGKYAYFGADVDGVKIKSSNNQAFAGTFAGVWAYNDLVIAPNGAGDLGLKQSADITDNVINSVKWAVSVAKTDERVIKDIVTKDNTGTRANYNDSTNTWTVGIFGSSPNQFLALVDYIGPQTDNLVLPATLNVNGVDYPVKRTNGTQLVTDSDLLPNATLTIQNGIEEFRSPAFNGCTNLSGTIVFPESVHTITGFASCPNITKIIVSGNAKYLGGFQDCTGLTEIDAVGSIESISQNGFSGCTALTKFDTSKVTKMFSNNAFLNANLSGALIINPTVTAIQQTAFKGTSFSGTLVIPASVTTIGAEFIANTDIDTIINQSNTNVTITYYRYANIDTVLNLGTGSASLSNATIKDNVPAIGYIAPLSNTAVVTKEGAVYDLMALLPLIMVLGIVMMGVYAVGTRYA